jgi:SNF2 family DNA or RNA helicase
LELPPIETETIWIDLNPNEMAMLRMEHKRSVREEIMKCAHYQLNEKQAVAVEEFMSINEVQNKMAQDKEREINNVKQDIASLQAKIEYFKSEPVKKDTTACEELLRASEKKLSSIQSSYNYFKSVFRVIVEPDRNACSICYDPIPAELLAILPCSHLYCFDCIKKATEISKLCPICKRFVEPKNIFRIRIKEPETRPTLENIDTSKYSTKLVALYHYMTDLIKRDPDSRIILFLQFKDLAEFIGKSLKELGIEYVRVTGNVFQRQNAIAKFRDSESVRLIMLSSEDSVSGINLTQATHIILLHPFYTGTDENTDLAYEKQGISRAYRFGLQHPLKIVRFAATGTVEESITLRREKIKLSN